MITLGNLLAGAALAIGAFAFEAAAQTADTHPATKEQAVAMVQKAVAFIKDQGAGKGYAAIDDKSGPFVQGDLYLAVVGFDGTLLAYGADGYRIGDNLMDLKDSDGKEVIKERLELAKQNSSFWRPINS